MRLLPLAPVAALLLAACAPADRLAAPRLPTAPRPDAARSVDPAPGTPVAVTRFLLERAAAGLLYTSESDYPFTYVFRAAAVPAPLAVEDFRRAFGIPPDAPVEVVSLDDFLARHIERVDPNDPVAIALVPRYRVLRETLRHAVDGVRVFRVGQIAIDCYLVGTDRAGNVVGLTTVAIET
jgi:hypothetical protein